MVTDAFGVVAMVAMTPLITIQGLGLVYQRKLKKQKTEPQVQDPLLQLDNYAIIEL